MKKEFNSHIERLRASNLRPTRQRIEICQFLFNRKNTFHFTILNLKQILEKKGFNKVSLATLYNTVHVFKKKGYLKEISLNESSTFFDTNIKNHHHFYDEEKEKLIDIKNDVIVIKNLPRVPNRKKIKTTEVIIRLENNNQKHKKKASK